MHPEDLEIKSKNAYCVESTGIDLESEASINRALETAVELLTQDPTNILQHEVFDPLYKMIRFLDNIVDEHKVELVESLCTALSSLMPMIEDALTETDAATAAARAPMLRNAFKMCVFLLSWLCTTAEKGSATKATTTAAPGPKGKGKGKKKRANHDAWSWEERQRERVTFAILESTGVDFGRLWKQSMVEEDFTMLFVGCGFQILENPAIVRAEFRDLRGTAIDIVCRPLSKHGTQLISGVTTRIIHLVTKFEHAAAPASEILATMAEEYKAPALGHEVVQEVGNMDPNDLARDLGGCRNLSSLLIETSEIAPQLVVPQLPVLMPHFDADNYPMRSALSQVVGELITAGLGKAASAEEAAGEEKEDDEEETGEDAQDGEEQQKQDAKPVEMDADMRDSLLELLAERVADKHGLTRSKVLQTWCKLTAARAIPLSFLPTVTDIAVSRIKDKSSQVRKYAVQLCGTLLECNPFSGELKLSALEPKYDELKAELAKLNGDEAEEANEAEQAQDEHTADEAEQGKEEAADGEGEEEKEAEADEDKEEDEEDEQEEKEDGDDTSAEEPTEDLKPAVVTEADAEALALLQKKVEYYASAVSFTQATHRAMETVMELLDSKAPTDVQEAIGFIVLADHFKVEKSAAGVRKMMMLVWSKNAAIKEHVIAAYKTLFLTRPTEGVHRSQKAMAIATSLVSLVVGATLGEVTSLEEIVTDMVNAGHIKDSTLAALWSMFGSQSASSEQSQAALMIISMAGNAQPKLIEANLGKLIAIGLPQNISTGVGNKLAQHACVALQKLAPLGLQLPASHQLFEHLRGLLVNDTTVAPAERAAFDRSWFATAEQALNTLFMLCAEPEEFCTSIVRALCSPERMWQSGGAVSKRGLSRVLFAVGHTAVKQFVYIETVSSKMKKDADAAEKKKAEKEKKSDDAPGSPRGLDAELGISAAIEEGEVEAVREMAEAEILSRMNLVGRFSSVITSLCGTAYRDNKPDGESAALRVSEDVRAVAVLALCKLMAVGAEFCEPNLRLLFTILKKDPSPRIRANIIIALGDLFFRFPNMLEPWSSHFFARLSDHDLTVRKHTLMALTHLILNDMVKVRAQVSDIAMCLEDEEPRMQDLARMFFNELAHKGTNNPIYVRPLPPLTPIAIGCNADLAADRTTCLISSVA